MADPTNDKWPHEVGQNSAEKLILKEPFQSIGK